MISLSKSGDTHRGAHQQRSPELPGKTVLRAVPRQFLFALLAVLVAVGLYFGLRIVVDSGEIGWICVLAAFPFALCGFFTYNGMTFERFLLAVIRSELLYPRKLVFRAENLYAQAMEHSTVKEALKID